MSAVVWPLARRFLRRRLLASLLTGLGVVAAVTVYLLFAAYFKATADSMAHRVQPLALPADLVVVGDRPFSSGELRRLRAVAAADAAEPFFVATVLTATGEQTLTAISLEAGPVAERLRGELAAGRLPAGPTEVLLPVGRVPSLDTGCSLIYFDAQSGTWIPSTWTVVGLYRPADNILDGPIVTPDGAARAFGQQVAAANALLIRTSWTPRQAATKVQGVLDHVRVITADAPVRESRRLVSGVLASGKTLIFLVYALAAAGLFNLVLLSFLQRKRALGTLKAIGVDNDQIAAMLVAEGLVVAVVGAAVGTAEIGRASCRERVFRSV